MRQVQWVKFPHNRAPDGACRQCGDKQPPDVTREQRKANIVCYEQSWSGEKRWVS